MSEYNFPWDEEREKKGIFLIDGNMCVMNNHNAESVLWWPGDAFTLTT